MSYTAIDIQRFVGNAIEKASMDNNMGIKFDIDNFMKSISNTNGDERRDDVVVEKEEMKEKVVVKKEIERINAQQEKKKLTKEERQANKDAKDAVKKAKEQAKADKESEKQAKEQAKADKLAAKEAEKQAKEQAKADKLAAKEAEKQAKEQAKAAKEAVKKDKKDKKDKKKEDAKPKAKRGRPKKDNVVVAAGDYIENVEAQSVDLLQQLSQDVQSGIASSDVTDTTSNDDDGEKFEDVQVHLFEFAGVMYYKSDDHVLYHHDTQDEIGSWDPVSNVIVYKEEE